MNDSELLDATSGGAVAVLDGATVEALLGRAEPIRTDATGIAGTIHTVRLDGRILVHERNPEGEHFVRAFDDEETAHLFVGKRLADYDRMWDG